jgi:hypothetical protein
MRLIGVVVVADLGFFFKGPMVLLVATIQRLCRVGGLLKCCGRALDCPFYATLDSTTLLSRLELSNLAGIPSPFLFMVSLFYLFLDEQTQIPMPVPVR